MLVRPLFKNADNGSENDEYDSLIFVTYLPAFYVILFEHLTSTAFK